MTTGYVQDRFWVTCADAELETGHNVPVLGRLADENSVEGPGGASPRFDAVLGEQARIPRKRGKVPAHPHSGPGLPGFDLGPPEYACISKREKDFQGYPPSALFAGENCPAGEDLAEVSRTLVQPPQVGSDGGSPRATDQTDTPRPVDTGLGQSVCTHQSGGRHRPIFESAAPSCIQIRLCRS